MIFVLGITCCIFAAQSSSYAYRSGNYVVSDFSQGGNAISAGIGCVQKATIKGGLLASLQQAGLPCGRFHAQLDVIFANPSQPAWGNLDYNLSQMHTSGIKAMLEMDYTPASLQPVPNPCVGNNPGYHAMPANPEAFGALAAQLVQHVDAKFPGTVTDYEIWNEPDLTSSLCTANGDQLDNYVQLFAATAPQMEAQARLDGQAIRVGGPALASPYYFGPTWVKRLLSDSTTASYINFISYHHYLTGNAAITWPQLYQQTLSGAGSLFSEVESWVPANFPIYLSEFNDDWTFSPDCCRNDATYAPLWITTYYLSLLNTGAMPARTVYYSSSNPPFCLFGTTYGDPTCAYPLAGNPVLEPQYYALSLLFSSSYLDLSAGGTTAQSSSGNSSLIVSAFTTPAGNAMVIANPTGEAQTNVSVIFKHPTTPNSSASVWTMQGGQPVATTIPIADWPFYGYFGTVNIPPYSVVAVKL